MSAVRVVLAALMLSAQAPAAAPAAGGEKTVLFLGDSLTAGFGLELSQAFPALIQKKIDRRGWKMKVVNAGVSGETSAGGLSRVNWLLRRPPAVLVLELGANDGLRGLPLQATERNLQGIIDRTRDAYPEVRLLIAGMRVPSNLGPRYSGEFRELFPRLAERNEAVLIPFLLEGVGGRAELNLADGIHPTAEGHRLVAETVWEHLEPVLEELARESPGQ